MQIQIDSREKLDKIEHIVAEFERQNIPHFRSKLYVADYVNILNPLVLIDRKQNIAEIAQNATSGHKRFKAELERAKSIGAKVYILIEQNKFEGKTIKSIEDIILWSPKFGQIIGEQIYRVLASWERKYDVAFIFCNKKNTGKKIIEILGGRNDPQ